MNVIELNLEGVKFKLDVAVPDSDDFEAMKKDWEQFFAFDTRGSGLAFDRSLINLNVAEDDDPGKDANEDIGDLQGSRLKADYEVSWDRDGFFRNTRNQTQEKTNRVSTMAADHYKSEAPRRHTPYARHSQRMCDQGDSGNPIQFSKRNDSVSSLAAIITVTVAAVSTSFRKLPSSSSASNPNLILL
ncbi:hypothetical protein HN873_057478 [Arachis hypogaea]